MWAANLGWERWTSHRAERDWKRDSETQNNAGGMVTDSTLLLKVGPTLKLKQLSPSFVQLCFEALQRWDFLCFSWQPVPMSGHRHCCFFSLFFSSSLPLCLSQNFHFPSYQSVDSKLAPWSHSLPGWTNPASSFFSFIFFIRCSNP